MMTFNKIHFDWNVVAELDPDYLKYLIDDNPLNKKSNVEYPEFDRGPVPRRLNTSMEDFRLQGRTEEELEIIQMMHDDYVSEEEELQEDYHYNRIDEIQPDPYAFIPRYKLKPEYKNPKLPAKMNPLQLMPPKTVLANESSIYPGDGYSLHYHVDSGTYNPSKKMKRLVKSKITDNGKMLRLIRAAYAFIPAKNVVSDIPAGFGCLTYNTETRRMYAISNRCDNPNTVKKTTRRYSRIINGIGLNYRRVVSITMSIDKRISDQFIRQLYNRVRKDVPDAFLPDLNKKHSILEQQAYQIVLLVLQHKIGKRIEWLDFSTLTNLDDVISGPHFFMSTGKYSDPKTANRARKRQVGKVLPNLKKHNNYTCFIESLFGQFYHKKLLKLVALNIPHYIRNEILKWLLGEGNQQVPKLTYHWLTEVLKMEIENSQKGQMVQNIVDFITDFTPATTRNKKKLVNMFDLYVKTSKRFMVEYGNMERWTVWRDMYRMAERFSLRIRPNKFKSFDDIRKLHDTLSEIERRDDRIIRKYRGVDFEPFEHPDKEYGDGFKFVWLGTPEALMEEGRMMHHCVGGYADRCIDGTSIIFSMRKDDRGYITIELNGEDYQIHQQYTIKDFTVRNEKILEMIDEWHSDVLKMHREDITTYQQKCRVRAAKFRLEAKIESLQKQLADFESIGLSELIEKRLETAKKYLTEFEEKVESGNILDEDDLLDEDDRYVGTGWPRPERVAQVPNN
jgi:hypothetical protein